VTASLVLSARRFLAVGIVNTLVGLGTIFLLKGVFGFDDVAANALGYAVGTVLGFVANRQWTFGSTGPWRSELVRYVTVLLAGYAINLAAVLWLIRGVGIDPYVAQAAGVVPYTLFVFLMSRSFVFERVEAGRPWRAGS